MSESTPFKLDFEPDDSSSRDASQEFGPVREPRAASKSRFKDIILLVSIISNIVIVLACAFFLFSTTQVDEYSGNKPLKPTGPLIPPGIEEEVSMPIRYGWEYYAESVAGMEEVDRNWDKLNPDIGVISLPRDKLDEWGVQILGNDPSDPNKAWVWIRASHSLHCLKLVRQTILQLAKGENLTMTIGHSMHCVGTLLRDIVCHADSSLPLKGENDKSDYQYLRKCRNWAAMSDWAAQRTICMTTGPDGILDAESQDFENCARTDGVILSAMSLPKRHDVN
ncbi:hypothetical protein VM1G_09144 [Cytospora mali]|uniref:Uncharacterized protein n=1 Tax=Cytospora mali TaxID=578113 RepID=A0A194WAN0_CYTMA|nr:hypothetical protein VM1G_09144 [Valsa mali]